MKRPLRRGEGVESRVLYLVGGRTFKQGLPRRVKGSDCEALAAAREKGTPFGPTCTPYSRDAPGKPLVGESDSELSVNFSLCTQRVYRMFRPVSSALPRAFSFACVHTPSVFHHQSCVCVCVCVCVCMCVSVSKYMCVILGVGSWVGVLCSLE